MTIPAAMTKRCTGPCGRELPVDGEHFYRQAGGDGFTPRCRACLKVAHRARRAAKAAERKREAASRPAPTTKRCSGPCGRELPIDAEYFHRRSDGRDGLASRCRDCTNAEHRERRAAPGEAAERCAAAKDALVTAKGALDGPIAELAELGGGSASPIGSLSSREGRLSFIRRRIEIAPPGQAAEAADRARRVMAAADRDVRELTRPPFDVAEVFMDMAAASSDEGVQVLATALRGQGWAP